MSRDLFDIPREIAFLNAANLGPRLLSVRAAEQRALDRWAQPWNLTANDWFADTERLRGLAARLFSATANDVAFVPSVSYAMAVAVANTPLKRGLNVVVLAREFPSNYYAWARHVREHDAELRVVTPSADGSWTDAIMRAMDAQTAAVAVPVCHWTDGTLIGIEAVAARARRLGAVLIIDASQSLGVMPLDVGALDPDFVVSVGYKWLLGPFGLSYLYVAPRHQRGKALEDAWPPRRGSEDLSRLTEYVDEFRDGARRFDAGEHQNFILLPMALAALEFVTAQNVAANQRTLRGFTQTIAGVGAALDVPATGHSRAPHLVGLRVGQEAAGPLAATLAARNVFVSARGDRLRVAPYLHTTEEDLARFAEALTAGITETGARRSSDPAC